MRSRRIAASIVILVVAVLLASPGAAWAHSRLVSTTPADATTVTAPIDEVSLTFNEPIHQRFSVVSITGPGGTAYVDGPLRVVDATVHQRVYPLRSGEYVVSWRVVSADDHPVQGEFRFVVALPPELEPSAAPPLLRSPTAPPGAAAAVPEQDRQGRWPYIAMVTVLVAAGAAVTVSTLQRRRHPSVRAETTVAPPPADPFRGGRSGP